MTIAAYRNSMTEKALMQAIRDAAGPLGYLAYHTFDSRRSEEGFPDLVIVKRGNLFFFETKDAELDPTTAQLAWLEELQQGRVLSARVVRPADLDDVLDELREAS